jgi:hypothetical protein
MSISEYSHGSEYSSMVDHLLTLSEVMSSIPARGGEAKGGEGRQGREGNLYFLPIRTAKIKKIQYQHLC